MRALRHLLDGWRSTRFSVKFTSVIVIMCVLIAAVPLWLAQANTRSEAENRASDKVGVADNLIAGQLNSLSEFIRGVGRQIDDRGDLPDLNRVHVTLAQDASVNPSSDLLGVVDGTGAVVAVQGDRTLAAGDPVVTVVVRAVESGSANAASRDGDLWLVAASGISGSAASAFVARPITAIVAAAIDTSSDPADFTVVRADGRYAIPGRVAGMTVQQGDAPDPRMRVALTARTPSVVTETNRDYAVATASLGYGYRLAVTTPVDVVATPLQPLILLIALIIALVAIIVMMVQLNLQRPLRRLDRAVAGLGRNEFDVPVPTGLHSELGRLGATFEKMRRELQSQMKVTRARAAVATALSAKGPLEETLAEVCTELRRSMDVDAVMVLVNRSEMNEPFAIYEGVHDVDVEAYLAGDGPIGEGYRWTGSGAAMLGAAPASREAHLGMRNFCVAPLRLGDRLHGVLAVASSDSDLTERDAELVVGAAEQVALALERYRMLAEEQRKASMDDLTGLYNHRFLVDYLGQQVALAERLNAPLAILMLDIDHFKGLNDTHGHQTGDQALAAFARTLVSSVRRSDLAARYGGEEFAVVMANTSAGEARLVAEKIRVAVTEGRISTDGGTPLSLTVSIGGAAFPEDTESARELLSLADEALYRAKRTGRDRTCMAGEKRTKITPRVTVVRDAATPPRASAATRGRRAES